MYLHLLVLLTLSVRTECLTSGYEFIVAFLENIAYYYPGQSVNKGRITAKIDGTTVTIEPANASTAATAASPGSIPLQAGEVKVIDISPHMELDKAEKSMKAVLIKSNKNITFEILNQRNKSIQSAVLLPATELGMEYQVPPIPKIQYTTQPLSDVTTEMTERSPFKLILVNSRDQNEITVDGIKYQLKSLQVLQIWVTYGMVGQRVIGTKPFLALFGHSCAVQFECTCGLLYTPLQPSTSTSSQYIVPPIFGKDVSAFFLKSSNGEISTFSEGIMTVNGPLLVHRPGMLMNLIPKTEFGSCFAVHTVENATVNSAVIVTPAASTQDVYNGNAPVTADWSTISDTDYKYATVDLNTGKNFIWNKSARMAVWYAGTVYDDDRAWFGNPAPRLSVEPDYRGCVVIPETLEILDKEMSWKESIKACKSRSLSLIILPNEMFQNQIYQRMQGMNKNLQMWMAMRKSAVTGKWYWLNETRLTHTAWSQGHPGDDEERRCAQMNLTDFSNPGWISKHCCTPGRPVCYKEPKFLTF